MVSNTTIPSVATEAASTITVLRFSKVVIIFRWSGTLDSILSLRACHRV